MNEKVEEKVRPDPGGPLIPTTQCPVRPATGRKAQEGGKEERSDVKKRRVGWKKCSEDHAPKYKKWVLKKPMGRQARFLKSET